jgi:hypothetical protein
MFKVLIPPCIGIVFILSLRTKKEQETIPTFQYNEETSVNGDSSIYIEQRGEARELGEEKERTYNSQARASSDF